MASESAQHPKPATSIEGSPRLALIGCGAIAEQYYLLTLARHPKIIQNLILIDRDDERAKRLALQYGARTTCNDFRAVIHECDGAIIALPTHLHYPVAMELLSCGVHVLCEKPLAESACKAQELVNQAQSTGTMLSVNYFQRLIPSFAKVKELLSKKTYGEPLAIQYYVGEEFRWPTVSGFYFNSVLAARGVLRDRGAHVMDHICWWLEGKPTLLLAENDSFGGSDATAHVRFSLGQCAGEVRLTWLCAFPSWFKVRCERGTISGNVYEYNSLVIQTSNGDTKQLSLKGVETTKLGIGDRVVSNFVAGITKGEKPLIAGRDVLNSIQLIDECYEVASRSTMPWYATPEVHHASL